MIAGEIADADLICRIVTHPKIYPHVADDMGRPPQDFEPIFGPGLHYVGVFDPEPEGLIFYHRVNAVTYEAHTCLLPSLWGARSVPAARATLAWMFRNTPCRKVVGNIPSNNRLSLNFARRLGFTPEGVNRASWMKAGRLYDLHLFGMTAGEFRYGD